MKTIEVAAAVIIKEKRLFATQRGYGAFINLWELPGGKVETGETTEAALKREIREELAVEIRVDAFVTTIHYDYPDFHLILHCYRCSVVSGKLTLLEHEAAKWLTRDELETVEWLPADYLLLEDFRKLLE